MNSGVQQRLIENKKVDYSYGPYNAVKGDQQWIRLTEGCCHQCPWCYEPREYKIFGIPEIVRNHVGIIDMNFLCKKESLGMLQGLPVKKEGKIIEYEFICGIDYRFLTKEFAEEFRLHHMKRIRLAWDWYLRNQYDLFNALRILYDAGFSHKNIIVFMICNHSSISYDECMKKLDLCKVWNVQVADCYYDNQINIIKKFIPIGWTTEEAHDFRRRCRVHNLIVKRGYYPELDNIQFKNRV